MIYISDYRFLDTVEFQNQLLHNQQNSNNAIHSILESFVGRTVTVFVNAGGDSGSGVTGIIIEVSSDSVKLMTKPSCNPKGNIPNYRSRFSQSCRGNMQGGRLGTNTVIMINQIVAITYHSL